MAIDPVYEGESMAAMIDLACRVGRSPRTPPAGRAPGPACPQRLLGSPRGQVWREWRAVLLVTLVAVLLVALLGPNSEPRPPGGRGPGARCQGNLRHSQGAATVNTGLQGLVPGSKRSRSEPVQRTDFSPPRPVSDRRTTGWGSGSVNRALLGRWASPERRHRPAGAGRCPGNVSGLLSRRRVDCPGKHDKDLVRR